jgi:hypothetical protein
MKPREIVIQGDVALIPLTQGQVAIIDAADVHMVAGVNWCADKSGNTYYAHRRELREGKWAKVRLHRLLLDAPPELLVDHRDGDGLNCRRNNLRLATAQQNATNRRRPASNKCGFKGVHQQGGVFVASITPPSGKRLYLGCFETPETAHAAYCSAGESLHGEFWRPA